MSRERGDAAEERAEIKQLVEALRLLASPYDVQIEALPSWVAVADEVAFTFDDAYSLVPRAALPRSALQILDRINDKLESMSDRQGGEIWSLDGLRDAIEWSELRSDALLALDALSSGYALPRRIDSYVRYRPIRFLLPWRWPSIRRRKRR
jgi:hypothetical protein